MKKGVILYVTGGKEEDFSGPGLDLNLLRRKLGVQSVRVATSEDDISEGW